jgi:thiol-disulfide isomerase/thioredoxin
MQRTLARQAAARAAVIIALGALGCAPPGTWRPNSTEPATFALLLNGGGAANINYVSHAYHLAEMHEVLLARGLDRRQISVLASDGDLPSPDLAVGRPATALGSWLLDGTYLERPLGHPVRYLNSKIPGVALSPATRNELDGWFGDARDNLKPGDALLMFVTDHGEQGKTPEQSRITLWQRQSVSAAELGQLVGRLPAGVKVVTVMSQCFSGGFAEMALHPAGGRRLGDTCGFFSTTADRKASGCYAESRGTDNEEGYAFKFIRGLRRSNRLAAAHAETLVTDRSPDVPVRTSDIYLARVVEKAAADRGVSVDALVDELAGEALAADAEQAQLIEHVARSFAIPLVGGPSGAAEKATLAGETRHLQELRDRLNDSADTWTAALGELTQATLDGFLAAHGDWAPRVVPRRLGGLSLGILEAVQNGFVGELRAFAEEKPGLIDRLRFGHNRVLITRNAAFRSEVRAAALLRLRTMLVSLVGQVILARDASPDRRAELAALRACEATALPRAGQQGQVAVEPIPFPPISNDDRLAVVLAPSSLGATFAEVPSAARAAARLPDGAVSLVAVDPGSPASAAGLQPGDVLVGASDEPLRDRGAMKLFLAGRAPATELEVRRGDRRILVIPALGKGSLAFEARELRAAGRVALGSLTSFRGPLETTLSARRPYLLFFWATWCTFCKQSIPELLALQRERGLSILAITDEGPRVLDPFFDRWTDPFPEIVAIDGDRRANEAFAVDGYPTFILVDGNGRVAMRSVGYRADTGIPIQGWKSPGFALPAKP